MDAEREFQRALRVAPWWAESYFNLAVAQETCPHEVAQRRWRNSPNNVRLWLLADIQRGSTERPVLALKRTSAPRR